jgi:hypothetical protein
MELSAIALADWKLLESKRLNGEPIAYLVGKKGFHNIELKVAPGVLIPRPETELLVEIGLREITRLGGLQENFVQITSSRPDEQSLDQPGMGGLATVAIRDCLLGKAKDVNGSGAVSMSEVQQCAQNAINLALKGNPTFAPHHVTVSGNRNLIPVQRPTTTLAAGPVEPIKQPLTPPSPPPTAPPSVAALTAPTVPVLPASNPSQQAASPSAHDMTYDILILTAIIYQHLRKSYAVRTYVNTTLLKRFIS